jgi:hypothetical protein
MRFTNSRCGYTEEAGEAYPQGQRMRLATKPKVAPVPSKPSVPEKKKPTIKVKEKEDVNITMKGAGKSFGKATLPTEMKLPVKSLGDLTICIHGEKKIGKSSLAKRFKNSFFFFFEPGGKGLTRNGELIEDWQQFKDFLVLLDRNREYADTLIIDTIDIAYNMCFKHVCEQLKIEHPQDLGFGKGWSAIKDEFIGEMDKLMRLGRGIIFLSHTDSKAFQRRGGGETHKLVSTMATAAREYITGVADMIAYYGYYGEERYLTIDGSDYVDAGQRLEENFITTTGERVHSIPMGNSADEAYENFVKAFNNLQEGSFDSDSLEATGLSNKRAKMVSTKPPRR